MRPSESIIAPHPPGDGREWDNQCARCGSSAYFEDCYNCDCGMRHHDCGEDCCCYEYPEPNVRCDVCRGEGGWWRCMSGATFCEDNPLPGRDAVKRGQIEWFTFDKPVKAR